MKLKKINAVLGLLSSLALLIHMAYSAFAYLTFYYNPRLKTLTALPFIILVCAHAICGMCAVFLHGDGTRLDAYPRYNRTTLIQRISAALIFPLLIVHLNNFTWMKNSAAKGQWAFFWLLVLLQLLFFGVVGAHISTSFSKGLITLGLLSDRKKQKTLDRICTILCVLIFLTAAIFVLRGELSMFLKV